MSQVLRLGVYRRFADSDDNRAETSADALERHRWRQAVLHGALDGDPAVDVVDWGQTDTAEPHEYVELGIALGTAAAAVAQYALIPLGRKIVDALVQEAVDKGTSSVVGWLASKLRPKQTPKQGVGDISIRLPDGTHLQMPRSEAGGAVTIHFAAGGKVTSIRVSD